MGIILGLTSALCWGTADFLARYASRKVGAYRAMLFMQIFGFVGLGTFLLVSGQLAEKLGAGWEVWGWATLAAVMNMVSSLSLYRSFEVGVLSVVAPIAASYAAITVVLSVLSGESLSLTRALGIVGAVIGVILAAISPDPTKTQAVKKGLPPGVSYALLTAVVFGVMFWLLGFKVTPVLGGVAPVWLIRLTSLVLLPLLALPLRQTLAVPRGSVWWYIAGVGVLDTAAFVTNSLGLATDQVAVVTVLGSLFSTVTVVLAWVILRERLQTSQWFGLALIFFGILLVNLPG